MCVFKQSLTVITVERQSFWFLLTWRDSQKCHFMNSVSLLRPNALILKSLFYTTSFLLHTLMLTRPLRLLYYFVSLIPNSAHCLELWYFPALDEIYVYVLIQYSHIKLSWLTYIFLIVHYTLFTVHFECHRLILITIATLESNPNGGILSWTERLENYEEFCISLTRQLCCCNI